ncbi:FAS1-like dehydratase domain-containing protein [Thalassococcus sp. BH17M4-6]|uniref:FAS1-like dehydratase domain-containing protein n=1 Tax=Thalassococcus sp. BH17M4-6 TaxID=3413148 RepID=UPI003BBC88F6
MQSDPPREASQSDLIDPARARALQATLGIVPDIETGMPLPPFFHYIYFWEIEIPAKLGRDGHPRVGEGLIPDMGLPRRMWAGGTLNFHSPLIAGVPAVQTVRVLKAERKDGRSGPLAFVTVEYAVEQDGAAICTEVRDIVYREDADPDAPKPTPPEARTDEEEAREVAFDSTMLFRYSALTFNGHRIHYDGEYAKRVEGYDGLVVHGPLQAQLLMLMLDRPEDPLRSFKFRMTAPLMHWETATLCRKGTDAWVRGPGGRQCLTAVVNG